MSTIYVLYRQTSQRDDIEILGYVEEESVAISWVNHNKVAQPSWSYWYRPVYPLRTK